MESKNIERIMRELNNSDKFIIKFLYDNIRNDKNGSFDRVIEIMQENVELSGKVWERIDKKIQLEKIELIIDGLIKSPDSLVKIWSCTDKDVQLEKIESIIGNIKEYPNTLIDFWKATSKKVQREKITQSLGKKENFNTDEIGLPRDMTIGIEIECDYITKDICNDFKYQGMLSTDFWFKYDNSVSDGVEAISPILRDEKKSWEKVGRVCNFFNNLGGKATERCGGHIHIGSNILGVNEKAWESFFTIWNESEEIIYKMVNEEGTVPRENLLKYAKPTGKIIEDILNKGAVTINSKKELQDLAEEYSKEDRYKGLNLCNIGKNKNTIEFRLANGTIDPEIIKQNVMLYGKILETARNRGQDSEYKKDEWDNFLKKDLDEKEKVEAFLGLVFDKEKDRDIYRSRWRSVSKEEVFSRIGFNKGKFKDKNQIGVEEIREALEGVEQSDSRQVVRQIVENSVENRGEER